MLKVAGGELFYQTFGQAGKPLLVIHGGPGLGCNYLLPQMSELGKFSFAIFYDQRGTGKSVSTTDWQSNPFEVYCEDIDNLRKALGFEKITLLGHSYGGIFASMYALKFPQHVDKIIYVNSVPLSSADYLEFTRHRNQIIDKSKLDVIRQTTGFIQGDPETIEKFYRLYFKSYFAHAELADTLSLTMTPQAAINNFKIYEIFYNYLTEHPFDCYQGLKVPTLIIAGDKDIIPLHYSERIHQSIPKSIYKVIKNCGHFPYIDEPKILFDCVRSFINLTSD